VKRVVLIAVVGALTLGALAGPVAAQAPEIPSPPPPLPPLTRELPVPQRRPPPEWTSPQPWFYGPFDRERINTNTNPGRTNATRGELEEQRTGFTPPPLGGNVM